MSLYLASMMFSATITQTDVFSLQLLFQAREENCSLCNAENTGDWLCLGGVIFGA